MPGRQLPDLPVTETFPDLRRALAGGRRAVLVAPPGAGKTTLVPLALLDEAWLSGQRIVILEPRRLATRAAARRMADILGESDGPMLLHGLQELHGRQIHKPRNPDLQPSVELLAQRYERFKTAAVGP